MKPMLAAELYLQDWDPSKPEAFNRTELALKQREQLIALFGKLAASGRFSVLQNSIINEINLLISANKTPVQLVAEKGFEGT